MWWVRYTTAEDGWATAKDGSMAPEWRRAQRLSAVGLEMAISPIVGWALGAGLDYLAGTTPVAGVLGLVFGFAAGLRALVFAAKRVQQDLEREEQQRQEGVDGFDG